MTSFQQFRNALGVAGLVYCVLLGGTCPARASGVETYGPAKLIISNHPGESIGALKWDSYKLPVRIETSGEKSRALVDLHGTLQSADENLVFRRRQLPLLPQNGGTSSSFSVSVELHAEVSLFNFTTVDPYGRTQKEKVAVIFPDWQRFANPPKVRWFLSSAGLALSDLHYQEANVIDMSELALTGKLNVAFRLDPHDWELGGNVFATLLPVPIVIPDGRPAARWYGFNGRIARRLPIDSVPATEFWLMTGWYMWGMIVNAPAESSYGVAYLGGPQLYLDARITPPGKRASWIYLKYASISKGLQIFSTSNREWAFGAGREISGYGKKHPWSLTLDMSDAQFADDTHMLHLVSFNLGVSVGL